MIEKLYLRFKYSYKYGTRETERLTIFIPLSLFITLFPFSNKTNVTMNVSHAANTNTLHPTLLGHFPSSSGEPLTGVRASLSIQSCPLYPTIKRSTYMLVETYPCLSPTYSYSHHQQEIILLVLKGSINLKRAIECQAATFSLPIR